MRPRPTSAPSPSLGQQIAGKRGSLRERVVRISQMMDVEMDPGSDLYRELRLLLTDLQRLLEPSTQPPPP